MPHPVDVHVGQKIKQLRLLKGLSQTDVAKKLRVSFQQIQKYEVGANRVAASRLYELSHIFDVPMSSFFEGLDEPALNGRSAAEIGMQIVSAVASIDDERMRARIVTFIEDVSGVTVARHT